GAMNINYFHDHRTRLGSYEGIAQEFGCVLEGISGIADVAVEPGPLSAICVFMNPASAAGATASVSKCACSRRSCRRCFFSCFFCSFSLAQSSKERTRSGQAVPKCLK